MLSMDCKNRGGNVYLFAYIARRIYIDVNLILCAYVDCMLARCNIYKSFNMYIPFVILYIYIRFRHYYVQEISYYVQAPGHNKRYFPVLLAWHSVRELRKLSSCCYYVQFGGHDNYNISTGSPYKYRIVLIVNNW